MSAGTSVSVSVSGLRKSFGERVVLDGVDLHVEAGSLTAILGASGSGKTTLMRLLAGFERADGGTIALGGRTVDGPKELVPPEKRRIGYVPQEGALFPHLTVAGNVAFGLRAAKGRDRAAIDSRVGELLELIGLAGFERRLPHHLSGGERQRVALARALAAHPALVLLDEPFSSLDVELRTSMRRDVVAALDAAGATAILVTHDQDEALSIADRVAVLQRGVIVQVDEPLLLYTRPVNGEVARFVGHGNLLLGRLEDGLVQSVLGEISVELGAPAAEPCAVGVLVRPEQIELTAGEGGAPSGVVTSREFHGHDVLVSVRLDEPAWGPPPGTRPGFEILVRLPGPAAPEPGSRVALRVRGTAPAWLSRSSPTDDRPTTGPAHSSVARPEPVVMEPGSGQRVGGDCDPDSGRDRGEDGDPAEPSPTGQAALDVVKEPAPRPECVGEHMDRHCPEPDDEARLVEADDGAPVRDRKERDTGAEQRQRREDEHRGDDDAHQRRRGPEPHVLGAPGVVPREAVAGGGQLQGHGAEQQHADEDVNREQRLDGRDRGALDGEADQQDYPGDRGEAVVADGAAEEARLPPGRCRALMSAMKVASGGDHGPQLSSGQ